MIIFLRKYATGVYLMGAGTESHRFTHGVASVGWRYAHHRRPFSHQYRIDGAGFALALCSGETLLDREKKLVLSPKQRNIGLVCAVVASDRQGNVCYRLKLRNVAQVDIEKRTQAIHDQMGIGHLKAASSRNSSASNSSTPRSGRHFSTNRAFFFSISCVIGSAS